MKLFWGLFFFVVAMGVAYRRYRFNTRRPIDETFMRKLLSLEMDDLIEDVRTSAVCQVVSVKKNGTILVLQSPKVGVTSMDATKMARTTDFRAIRKTDGNWTTKRHRFMMQF